MIPLLGDFHKVEAYLERITGVSGHFCVDNCLLESCCAFWVESQGSEGDLVDKEDDLQML